MSEETAVAMERLGDVLDIEPEQKVEDLYAQGKLTEGGRSMLLGSFQAAQDCISYP